MTVLFLILVISCSSFRFLGEVNVQIDLGKVQIEAKVIVVSAEVVQILIDFQVVFGSSSKESPFSLASVPRLARGRLMVTWGGGAGGEYGSRKLGLLPAWRVCHRAARGNGLHDLMISRQFGGNAHLLHQGVRNALAGSGQTLRRD